MPGVAASEAWKRSAANAVLFIHHELEQVIDEYDTVKVAGTAQDLSASFIFRGGAGGEFRAPLLPSLAPARPAE